MINITVMRKVSYVKKFWFYPVISAFLSFSYLVYIDGFVSVKDLVQEKNWTNLLATAQTVEANLCFEL